jgi:hypothetical protein
MDKKSKKCCDNNIKNTDKQCIREKDNKKFKLPRKYTKDNCKEKKIKSFSKKASCAPYKYCLKGGGSTEDMEKMAKSLTKQELTGLLGLSTETQSAYTQELQPETELQNEMPTKRSRIPFPQKLDKTTMGFFPQEVTEQIYDNVVDLERYPDQLTCKQVKHLCGLDLKYCKKEKYKEKFHELCKEIKKTNQMIEEFGPSQIPIRELIDSSDEESDFFMTDEEDYDYDKYMYVMNTVKKLKFNKEVMDILKKLLKPIADMLDNKDTKQEWNDNIKWYDILVYFKKNLDEFKKIMYEYGKNLHSENSEKYYPVIVEKIKQQLLRVYFIL